MAGGNLKKVPIQGGASEVIEGIGLSMGLNWNEDNIIVSSTGIGTPIQMLHLDTGESTTMAKFAVGEAVHVMPHLLPGSKGLLFVVGTSPSLPTSNVELYIPETGERRVLIREATRPKYLSSAHIVVLQEGRLTALRFDLNTLEAEGRPFTVLSTVEGINPRDYDISTDGTLVYAQQGHSTLGKRSLVWVDDSVQEERVCTTELPYFSVDISPDGSLAVITLAGQTDIYILDLVRGGTPDASSSQTNPACFQFGRPTEKK